MTLAVVGRGLSTRKMRGRRCGQEQARGGAAALDDSQTMKTGTLHAIKHAGARTPERHEHAVDNSATPQVTDWDERM